MKLGNDPLLDEQSAFKILEFCKTHKAFCHLDSRAQSAPMVGNVFFEICGDVYLVCDMQYPEELCHIYCDHPGVELDNFEKFIRRENKPWPK